MAVVRRLAWLFFTCLFAFAAFVGAGAGTFELKLSVLAASSSLKSSVVSDALSGCPNSLLNRSAACRVVNFLNVGSGL